MEAIETFKMAQVCPAFPINVLLAYYGDESDRNLGYLFRIYAQTPFDLEIWRVYSPVKMNLMFKSWLPRMNYNLLFPYPLYPEGGDPLDDGNIFELAAHRFGVWETQSVTKFVARLDETQQKSMAVSLSILNGYSDLWPWRYYWGDEVPPLNDKAVSHRPWSSVWSAIIRIDPPAVISWWLNSNEIWLRLAVFPVTPESGGWQTLTSSTVKTFATPPLDEQEVRVFQSLAVSGQSLRIEFTGGGLPIPARLRAMTMTNTVGGETVYNLTLEYEFA